jgi:DNA ligase-associated metallophosphoesterase
MVPFSFAGETFFATASGALYRPEQSSLLVADLHLEKASWFARLGQFLPPYDSHATLTALAEEVERIRPSRVFCLGDSFHDNFGCERLPDNARALLTELMEKVAWTWIVGNHDASGIDHCGGSIEHAVETAGVVYRHEAFPGEPRPEISGHFHPKLRVNLHGRHVSRRCFVVSATKIIMPAFGALTGGLDAHHPEILRSVGDDATALVPVSDRLLRFPLAA